MEDTISTVGVFEYSGGISSVLWEIPSVLWGCSVLWRDIISAVGNTISTVGVFSIVEGYHQCCGGYHQSCEGSSVLQGDTIWVSMA